MVNNIKEENTVIMQGIHFMMPTPFNLDGSVDLSSIVNLVSVAKSAKCTGVVCLGVTGEAIKLTDIERKIIVEEVMKHAVANQLSVTVGTSGNSNEMLISRSQEAQDLGANAIMVAPPQMLRPNLEKVEQLYSALISNINLPVVIQDYPKETNVIMPPSFIKKLNDSSPLMKYLKLEDPPTPQKVSSVLALTGDKMEVFGGLGGLFLLEELMRGAKGTMTGFAYPNILVEIFNSVVNKNFIQASEIFYKYLPIIRYEAQEGIGLAIRKEILYKRGILKTAFVRQPGPQIDDITRLELDELMTKLVMKDFD